MSEALIGGIAAVVVGLLSLLGNYMANRKNQAVLLYRIDQLEKKQDKHNNLIERTYILEGRMTEVEHDLRDLKGAKK